MIPIVVMASGRGSNFTAIARAVQSGELQAEILAVISDRTGAPVLEYAARIGIPSFSVPFPGGSEPIEKRREDHDFQLTSQLRKLGARFVVMAGYMRIVSSSFIEAFRSERGYSRIVNIHPSLLPAFPGTHSYAKAFHHGVKITGATVHLVESAVDSGPICAQAAFSISDCHTEAEVEQKGLENEHRLYPQTLKWVLPEKFTLENRSEGRLCVRPN